MDKQTDENRRNSENQAAGFLFIQKFCNSFNESQRVKIANISRQVVARCDQTEGTLSKSKKSEM